ncbi:MAG: protein kinase domain-containing protein, partial [Methylococcales bacterium]
MSPPMNATIPLVALTNRTIPVEDLNTAARMPGEAGLAEPRTAGGNDPPSILRPAVDRSTAYREELQVGAILKDRFVLKEILGSGGMGVVFKALDRRKQEARDKEPYVAVKVLNSHFRNNPESFIALQRETKRAQTLSHPNVVTVYDFDRDGSHVFMTMECLSGQPLNKFIKGLGEKGLALKRAWPIIQAMGQALAYA